jgi:hypothetical protein
MMAKFKLRPQLSLVSLMALKVHQGHSSSIKEV